MLDLESSFVIAAQSGGADLDRLIERVWPEAFRIAAAILNDRGLAEDAAQEACARIANRLSALRNAAAFRAWAYRIVANAAVTAARRNRRSEPLDASERIPFTDPDIPARIDLSNALLALPVDQRAAVILHYYAGLTSDEIAGGAGLQASTVRFRLMLARRALHAALEVSSHSVTSTEEVIHG